MTPFSPSLYDRRDQFCDKNTKEMQKYTAEKSMLAVFEEILLKSCLEHSKLLKDKTKVTEGGEKTLQ